MYRRPYHILVVDDTPATQHQALVLLGRRDYKVITAWTLHDAYARFDEFPIDLVVAGTRIGSMHGLQFILSCRARHSETAGIIIAAQGEPISDMDIWRHNVVPLVLPLHDDHFLMLVAERLAALRRRQRWPRKSVKTDVPVFVGGTPGRLVDVSYGGLRLEIQGESYDLRSLVQIDIPTSQLRVNAELVWSARAQDGASCLCGVSIIGDRHPVPIWREFVDQVA